MADLGPCRACPATVRWVVVAKTGRRMPLDPEPREDGNVRLDHTGQAVVVGKAAKARILASVNGASFGPWYVSHFVTCAKPRTLDELTT